MYSKSPIALDKFKLPLILPSLTNPPAFLTLSFSYSYSGLWSKDNSSITPPFLDKTLLESPALAQYKVFLWIKETLAVQPAYDSA